jgi:uncharacterized protein (DUF2249 family)
MKTNTTIEMIELDVRHLPAPEPMTQIIQALAKLTEQQYLQVHHRREPFPLYEKLSAAGWQYYCQPQTEESFFIYIYQPPFHQYVMALTTKS